MSDTNPIQAIRDAVDKELPGLVGLTEQEKQTVAGTTQRLSELAVELSTAATPEQVEAIQSEAKACYATLLTMGEAKASATINVIGRVAQTVVGVAVGVLLAKIPTVQ